LGVEQLLGCHRGLLDRIQALGLELVEIRQLPAAAESLTAEPEPPP
jgi:hypothetical protein